MSRRGMVLPTALSILMLLGMMGMIIHLLQRQSYRTIERLDGFLRAVSVGEAAFTRVLARLEAMPWDQRWFAGSPRVEDGTWEDGSYQYIIADGRRPGEAELLVRAQAEGSRVVLYWRLRADAATLSPYRRVRTRVFMHGDPATPITPDGLVGVSGPVDQSIAQRETNRPWEQQKEEEVLGNPDPGAIQTTLQVPGPLPLPTAIPPPVPGGPPVPLPSVPALPPVMPPPLPPGEPPGTTADPALIEELARARRALDGEMATLRKANALARGAFADDYPLYPSNPAGSVTYPDSLFRELQKRVEAERARCGTPPSPPCPPGLQDCEDRIRDLDQRRGQLLLPLERAIARLQDDIRTLITEMDNAMDPPGPDRGRAEDLLSQVRQIKDQVRQLVQDIEVKVRDAEASLRGPCASYNPDLSLDPQ